MKSVKEGDTEEVYEVVECGSKDCKKKSFRLKGEDWKYNQKNRREYAYYF